MSVPLTEILAGAAAGAAVGALYFAWVWRSVRALSADGADGARLIGGALARLALLSGLVGLAVAAGAGGPALLGGAAGFLAVRHLAVRLARPRSEDAR